jgi:hypothetical protein
MATAKIISNQRRQYQPGDESGGNNRKMAAGRKSIMVAINRPSAAISNGVGGNGGENQQWHQRGALRALVAPHRARVSAPPLLRCFSLCGIACAHSSKHHGHQRQ